MTSIQRPGGPAGPGGPSGPDDPDALSGPTTTSAAGPSDRAAELAAALDAGQLPPDAALAQLVDDAVAGLPADEAAELRALLADAMAADPYLAGLARELGATVGGNE
jgi:hypothetical protein